MIPCLSSAAGGSSTDTLTRGRLTAEEEEREEEAMLMGVLSLRVDRLAVEEDLAMTSGLVGVREECTGESVPSDALRATIWGGGRVCVCQCVCVCVCVCVRV